MTEDNKIANVRNSELSKGLCGCAGVEFGSYENTILLGYYPCMIEYQQNRIKAGLSGAGIVVDKCIVGQVIELWNAGIRTYGCCCGHNKLPGFINVDERDFNKAIAMGWKKYEYENDLDRCDTLKTKTT